jgi:type IV pilus assembly protein PilA
MRYAHAFQPRRRYFIKCTGAIAAIFLVASACAAQAAPTGQSPDAPLYQELNKYPGLLPEIGQLFVKLQHDVQYPQARSESRLLPLVPESTLVYAAYPNYGDAVHQSLKIFRQELQESSPLRDWYQHGPAAEDGPKVEDFLEKLYQLSQYLGDEIVLSASTEDRRPSVLIIAEIRKPGLKKMLQQMLEELAGKSKPGVRILDAQELATTENNSSTQEPMVLVRPDFVVAAFDLTTLKSFNTLLDQHARQFASTPFGQRVARAYQDGVKSLVAADVQKILTQIPRGTDQSQLTFERSGFADIKYLVSEQTTVAGQGASEMELSFTGPRHGAASWLAVPTQLGSLDFVSPKAMLVGAVTLTNPAQIFEDVKEIAGTANSSAFTTLAQFEQGLKLSLKDDILSRLTGEITAELDDLTPPKPVWKAMLRVNDANRLQQTLSTLLSAFHLEAKQSDDGKITYYTLRIPSSTPVELSYAFVDGYLIIASSREAAGEAVRLHGSGESLGKSKKFLASLPTGHASGLSAFLYEDPTAIAMLALSKAAPQMAEYLPKMGTQSPPLVVCAYGEQSAIRTASTNSGFGAGAVLVIAAIAIPNLLRSKIAANEASAAGSVRTVNVAEITYAATYPERGFAPDLATLGPDPREHAVGSADHAGVIDASLAGANCTADTWCTKSGFRFSLTAVCKQKNCNEFVIVGTPVASDTGARSFCSTSDGIIRFKTGSPLTSPLSAPECRTWPPLQ